MKYTLLAALIAATSLTACNSSSNSSDDYSGYVAQEPKPAKITEFRNVVYASYMKDANDQWFDNPHSNEISDLNIAFMNPSANMDEDGIYHPDGHVAALSTDRINKLTSTIRKFKDQNPDGRVFISFGGWRDSEKNESDDNIIGRDIVYEKVAASPEYRENLINDMMDVVNTYGFDGVDLDWEYPQIGDGANQYADFVNRLADRLHAEGKYFTAAIIGSKDKPNDDGKGAGYLDVALNAFDTVHLMTYDMQNEDHSSYKDSVNALNYWLIERHLDPQRITLGLPAYPRHAPTYGALVKENKHYACRDTVTKNNTTHYYNGLPTIRSKVHLAKDDYHLGGVMLWELPCDDINPEDKDLSIIETISATIKQDSSYRNICDKNKDDTDWIVYREDDPMKHYDW
ncbi:chitinase, containing dual catalytic domains [Photobacterium sp. SKA34]|uniref:glycosyl hydrolase family 18 protein n=1 Tax=Photobacterium sp. SKA34 TaxID=121723 RepID=UPI00006ABE25|nr:glycosyl hydrolase family 18 protein [Photobacterium sp. SKA34]EAR55445.1 chitinase, containing dual catalytic domains [Photobacterium sp. SKA34]